jgi:hypothetical protein
VPTSTSVTPETIIGNPQYRRGFKLTEDREGNIALTYVENSDSPFRSPVVVTNGFDNWSQAFNFIKIWDLLRHVRWW